jgi:ArsR family transcriptional regulator
MIDILKALSDETRLRIFNLLKEEALCVCEIETLLNISQSNTSRHLNKLKQSNVIRSTKDAQWVHYEITEDFKNHHGGLTEELSHYFKNNNVYIEDSKRYTNYKMKNLSCTEIREDKASVLNLIK